MLLQIVHVPEPTVPPPVPPPASPKPLVLRSQPVRQPSVGVKENGGQDYSASVTKSQPVTRRDMRPAVPQPPSNKSVVPTSSNLQRNIQQSKSLDSYDDFDDDDDDWDDDDDDFGGVSLHFFLQYV